MLSRVIAKNVGDVFLRHSVYTSATQGSNDNTQTATQDSNEKPDTAHV